MILAYGFFELTRELTVNLTHLNAASFEKKLDRTFVFDSEWIADKRSKQTSSVEFVCFVGGGGKDVPSLLVLLFFL